MKVPGGLGNDDDGYEDCGREKMEHFGVKRRAINAPWRTRRRFGPGPACVCTTNGQNDGGDRLVRCRNGRGRPMVVASECTIKPLCGRNMAGKEASKAVKRDGGTPGAVLALKTGAGGRKSAVQLPSGGSLKDAGKDGEMSGPAAWCLPLPGVVFKSILGICRGGHSWPWGRSIFPVRSRA